MTEYFPFGCPTCGGVPTDGAIGVMCFGYTFPVRVYTPRECCAKLLTDWAALAELDLQMRKTQPEK